MASSLPPEIWFTIVEYLPGNDQLRVSQVSPQLCAVARKIVFRDVELRSNHVAVEATLALLTRDYSVARNVRRLHIYTDAGTEQVPTWFDPDVLSGMANLCRLDLTRMPFHTKEDQLKFNNVYPDLKSQSPRPELGTQVPVLQISGLHELTWIDPETFVHPAPILTTIHASRKTLTHIHTPAFTTYTATYDPLTRFFSLHLPRLSKLHLGGWNTVTPVSAALTSFLIAHPLIEDLHLGFSNPYSNELHCHISSDITLSAGTLPNLRCLTADAFNLSILVRNRISSLQTLENLRTGVGYLGEEEQGLEFADMYRVLEAYGGLPGLKVLELEGFDNELENALWIAGLGKLCPKVERFWGDYEVGISAVLDPDSFASYTNLKSQVRPDTHSGDLAESDRMNHVREFAVCNPPLTDLRFYAPTDVNVTKFHYRMERDVDGRITAIFETQEDGTKIVWICV